MKENYEIVDVDESNKGSYCLCLEEWSDEIREAGDHKACWYEKMKDKGLGVKLVKDSDGSLSGLIQYIPAEYAPLTGEGFYFIYCIWVHGYKKGIGKRQGRGMGTALLEAAEADLRSRGATGAAAWGVSMPFWMKASWYRKHGYRAVQKDGIRLLMWKPFREGLEPPRWYESLKTPDLLPASDSEKGVADSPAVTVTSVMSGICPVTNLARERAEAVASEFGDEVGFQVFRTDEPGPLREWGTGDILFINEKRVELGPPLSKVKIRKLIRRELKRSLRL